MRFYSQVGQDRYLFDHYFAGRCGLTFVDIGAYDGEMYSNTLFFEETLGWRGLCIEPLSEAFEKLQRRRNARCIQCAVSDYSGTGQFLEVDAGLDQTMLSGLSDSYEEQHRQRLGRQATSIREYPVTVARLDSLLADAKIENIDYCSIDTEGSELSILRSFDPAKHRIDVLSIENNYQNPEIRNLLTERGYHLETIFHGYDELYVRRDLTGRRQESAVSKVSIIIPTRFRPIPGDRSGTLWIDRAIASLRMQAMDTPTKYEVVAGIDCDAVIPKHLIDSGVTIRFARTGVGRPKNQAAALNSAMAIARGSVLAILEDDDQWCPDRMRVGLRALNDYDFVSCTQDEVGLDGTALFPNDNATPSGWMFHRHVWNRIGGFNETIQFHIDNDWLGRLNRSNFTRCHQVESGFPLDTDYIRHQRPQLYQLIRSVPEGSILTQPGFARALVKRTANSEGRMKEIMSDTASSERSRSERDWLVATYGTRCF